jgi:endonuclease I
MKVYIFTIVFLLFFFVSKSQVPDGYYNSADGLTGEQLKIALYEIIKGHYSLDYAGVKEALMVTDQDTVDTSKVICLYTGWTYAKTEFGNGSQQWNREHVWSRSHGDFGIYPPEGTDLHHLRPADASVNSAKSNRDFDYGTVRYIDASGATDCYKGDYSWEPRDEVKGDVARMIFYMATRYEGEDGELNLEILDTVNTAPDNEPFYGKLSTLLEWHHSDPVSKWEKRRNDTIYYVYQHNRNPFIDHPEYVDKIWGSGILDEPSNHVSNFIVSAKSGNSITLNWNDNDGVVPASNFLLKVNKTGVFAAPEDGNDYPNDIDVSDGKGSVTVSHGTETYTWRNLEISTKYFFTIYTYNNSGASADYKANGIVPEVCDSTDSDMPYSVILLTEIADPSDVYRARYVEITNAGSADIDLDIGNWYLSRQANGNPDSWADIKLTGVLKAGESMSVAYGSQYFLDAYGFQPAVANGNISGNGDDGYFIFENGNHETGTLVDAYGEIDTDGTGTDWQYTDSRAYRIYSVVEPSLNWNPDEWIIEPAATKDMTPDWHYEVLYWNGTVSNSIVDVNNWTNGSNKIPQYSPDASCKLIITNYGNIPVINQDIIMSTIELNDGSALEINSNSILIIKGK